MDGLTLLGDTDNIPDSVMQLFNSCLRSQNKASNGSDLNQAAIIKNNQRVIRKPKIANQVSKTAPIQKSNMVEKDKAIVRKSTATVQASAKQQQTTVQEDQKPSASSVQPVETIDESNLFPNLYPYPRQYKYATGLVLTENEKRELDASLDRILRPTKKDYEFDHIGSKFVESLGDFKKNDDAIKENALKQIDSCRIKIGSDLTKLESEVNKINSLDSTGNSPHSLSPDHILPQFILSQLNIDGITNCEKETDANQNCHILDSDCNIMAGHNIGNIDENNYANRSSTPVNQSHSTNNMDSAYGFSIGEILHACAFNPVQNAIRARAPSEGYRTLDSRIAAFDSTLSPSTGATGNLNLINTTHQQSQFSFHNSNIPNQRFDNNQNAFDEPQILDSYNSDAYTGAYYPRIIETAKRHRLAAQSTPTESQETRVWNGTFVTRIHKNPIYSTKVFLGGVPWSISEKALSSIFEKYGKIRIEWPGKEVKCTIGNSPARCGYLYIILESSDAVKALINDCVSTLKDHVIKYYFSIKSRRIEVIPWVLADSNWVKNPSQRLDPKKTGKLSFLLLFFILTFNFYVLKFKSLILFFFLFSICW